MFIIFICNEMNKLFVIIPIIIIIIIGVIICIIYKINTSKHDTKMIFDFKTDDKPTTKFEFKTSLTNSECLDFVNDINEIGSSSITYEKILRDNEYIITFNITSKDALAHSLILNSIIDYLKDIEDARTVIMDDKTTKQINDLYINKITANTNITKDSIKTKSNTSNTSETKTETEIEAKAEVETKTETETETEAKAEVETKTKTETEASSEIETETEEKEEEPSKKYITIRLMLNDSIKYKELRYLILDHLEDYHNKIEDILDNYKGNVGDRFKDLGNGIYIYTLIFNDEEPLIKAYDDIMEKLDKLMYGIVVKSDDEEIYYQFVDPTITKAYMKQLDEMKYVSKPLTIDDDYIDLSNYKLYEVKSEDIAKIKEVLRKAE